MIDLHCHVLPGIDDGPPTIEDSVAIARAAAMRGTRVMVATPHVSLRYPNEPATISRLTSALNEKLGAEEVAVEIRMGAEISIARIEELADEEISALTLGGGPWLLVECPFAVYAPGIETFLLYLKDRGHRIVLAHPERSPVFQRDASRLESLVSAGMLTSITAGSLVGRFGRDVRRFAMRLVAEGLVHNVASDAHDLARRPPGMAAELAEAGLGALAAWLAHEVPSAILGGEPIPPRPASPPVGKARIQRIRRRRR